MYRSKPLEVVGNLTDGPLAGETRAVNKDQKYVAWTLQTDGPWRWIIYEVGHRVSEGVYDCSYVGTATGTHPNFSYENEEIHWDGKEATIEAGAQEGLV